MRMSASVALLFLTSSCARGAGHAGEAAASVPMPVAPAPASVSQEDDPPPAPARELDWARGIALEDEGYTLLERGDASAARAALACFEESCAVRRSCGQAQVGAALAMIALGERARGQRRLERTRAALEREAGGPARLDTRAGAPRGVLVASPVGDRWAVVAGDEVSLLHGGTLRETLRAVTPPLDAAVSARARVDRVCVDRCHAGAFSPNGRWLAWADLRGAVHVLDLARAGAEPVRLASDAGDEPMHVAFSADGRSLAANVVGGVALWSVPALVRVGLVPGTTPFAFSADGARLATSRGAFDVATGRPLEVLRLDADESAWTLTRDGARMVTTRPHAAARVRDLLHGGARSLDRVVDPFRLEVSPDGTRLVSTPITTSATLWDVTTLQELESWSTGQSYEGVGFSPDGTVVATWGSPARVLLRDVVTHRAVPSLDATDLGGRPFIDEVVFSLDGRKIAARIAPTHELRVWEAASGNLEARWPGREERPACVLGRERYPAAFCTRLSHEDARVR
jgi:hypothetical protein